MNTTLASAVTAIAANSRHSAPAWRYRLFGYTVASELELGGVPIATPESDVDLLFTLSSEPPLDCPPQRPPPIYVTPGFEPDDPGASYLFRLPEWHVLGQAGAYEFYVGQRRIHCRLLDATDLQRVRLAFLGAIYAYWLELQGDLVLHASAVSVDGRTIAFIGSNGAGKSSLAGTFLKAGSELVTDDSLAVRFGDSIEAIPALPSMRFQPQHGIDLFGANASFTRIHPRAAKRAIDIVAGGLGAYRDRPLGLGALYLLRRKPSADPGRPIVIAPVSPQEAMVELIRHSSVARAVEAAGLQPRRLTRMLELVASVPMAAVEYPTDVNRLPDVRRAIEADFRRKLSPPVT